MEKDFKLYQVLYKELIDFYREGKLICVRCKKNISERYRWDTLPAMCIKCGRVYCEECDPEAECGWVNYGSCALGCDECPICRDSEKYGCTWDECKKPD